MKRWKKTDEECSTCLGDGHLAAGFEFEAGVCPNCGGTGYKMVEIKQEEKTMEKVWVRIYEPKYEGSVLDGVFATREAAVEDIPDEFVVNFRDAQRTHFVREEELSELHAEKFIIEPRKVRHAKQ